jgi:hypothetical protein
MGWDDEVVEIRELTVAESNEVQALMLNDSTSQDLADGTINVSIGKFEEAKTKAVSMALVNPKLSEADINGMSSCAKDGISEIYEAIGAINEPKK